MISFSLVTVEVCAFALVFLFECIVIDIDLYIFIYSARSCNRGQGR